ncbi:MAG: DUF4062 domain-containing protein [Dehalococcoidia bacterium]|nr:DUF4062 domain-containing protein [Dehalococcoidia bacterium]
MAKVFISSVITGFEAQRDAVAQAIINLGHQVVRAEDFGVRPDSPQRACLGELRDSDLVVLVMGERYGAIQAGSGLSATHEEFREAASNKPLLVFVEDGVELEAAQQAFLSEVQDWASGKLTGRYSSPEVLQGLVTRAIHDWEVRDLRGAKTVPDELAARAREIAGDSLGRPELVVALAFGPLGTLVPVREFESHATEERVYDHAVAARLFRKMARVDSNRDGGVLQLDDGRTRIRVAQDGAMAIVTDPTVERSDRTVLAAIVAEDLASKLEASLGLGRALIEHIDPTERAGDVSGFVLLRGVGWVPWRTAAEYAADGGSGTMNSRGDSELLIGLPETPTKRSRLFYRTKDIAAETAAILRREATR